MDRFDPKQPDEAYYLGFDFSACFTDDNGVSYDQVSSVNSISVLDPSGADKTSEIIDQDETLISGSMVKVLVQGGESGKTYHISVRVTGAVLSETFEMDALLPVVSV